MPTRTIDTVYNTETGIDEPSEIYLKGFESIDDTKYVNFRKDLYDRTINGTSLLKCYACMAVLELSCIPDGNDGHTFYFRHSSSDPKSKECHLNTGLQLTKEEIQRRQYLKKKKVLSINNLSLMWVI